MVNVRFVALLMLVPVLAGCAGKEALTTSSLQDIDGFDGFTWPAPQTMGPNAELFLEVGTAPIYVEQLTPLTAVTQQTLYDPLDRLTLLTMTPPVAVDADGSIFTMAVDELFRSTDGGITWEIALDFLQLQDPDMLDRWETTDRALFIDQGTNTIYVSFMSQDGCQILFISDDGGDAWRSQDMNDWPESCADARDVSMGTRVTHSVQLLGGPRADSFQFAPGFGDRALYWCEETAAAGPRCSASWDEGRTFTHEGLLAPADEGCEARTFGQGDVRGDGAVALPLGPRATSLNYAYLVTGERIECGAKPPEVSYSTDGGLTWNVAKAPAGLVMESAYPSLDFGPDGTAYLAYRGEGSKIQLLRSPDLFQTWEGPYTLSLPSHLMGAHPAVTVGDDGHVAVAFLGSSSYQSQGDDPGELPARPETAETGTIWHMFTATSLDADADQPTFYVQQMTPSQDPIHMGCIRDYPVDYSSYNYACYNMGQFTDIITSNEGRVHIAHIDGCTPRNGCSADVEGAYAYRDRQVMVATLDQGTGLRAGADLLESLGLSHPQPQHEDDEVYGP